MIFKLPEHFQVAALDTHKLLSIWLVLRLMQSVTRGPNGQS